MSKQKNRQAKRRAQRNQTTQRQQNAQPAGIAAKANRGAVANRQAPAQRAGATTKQGAAQRNAAPRGAAGRGTAQRGTGQRQQAPLPAGVIDRRNVYFITNVAPTNSTAAGKAFPGMLCVDSTTGLVYVNTGTLNAPNWQVINATTAITPTDATTDNSAGQ